MAPFTHPASPSTGNELKEIGWKQILFTDYGLILTLYLPVILVLVGGVMLIPRSGRFRAGGRNGGSRSPGPGSGNSPTSPTGSSQSGSVQGASAQGGSPASFAPRVPPLPNSPSLSSTLSLNGSVASSQHSDPLAKYMLPSPKPLFLDEAYAKHIVKGNFMTLSAKPITVEQGEWIAHQVVEHYRILWDFVRVIADKEEDGYSICNPHTCPKMSAGINHSFTWLNSKREPKEVSAAEYIGLMQRWINSKIENPNIFPTDPAAVSYAENTGPPAIAAATYASGGLNTPGSNTPIPAGPTNLNMPLSQLSGPGDWVGKSSGFPADFFSTCQAIFKQMFRVYAHLYWAHFIDPFYHFSLERQLNSCFSHFILTSTQLDMIDPTDLGPMQPLIDLWAANGTFPKNSRAYACADLRAGERLMAISSANQQNQPSQGPPQ